MTLKSQLNDKFWAINNYPHVSSLLNVLEDLEQKPDRYQYFIDMIAVLESYMEEILSPEDFESYCNLVDSYIS